MGVARAKARGLDESRDLLAMISGRAVLRPLSLQSLVGRLRLRGPAP